MRILIVTNYILPHIGGVEVVVDHEIRLLLARGHEVTVIAAHTGNTGESETHANLEIIRIPAWNGIERSIGIGWPVFSPRVIIELWRCIGWCDAVHVHGYLFSNSLLALLIARLRKKRSILTEHTGMGLPASGMIRLLLWLCTRSIGKCNLRLAHSIIGINRGFVEKVRRARPFADTHLLPCTLERDWLPTGADVVNIQEKHNARILLGLPIDKKIVLFVGRAVAIKGVDLLLEAFDGSYYLVFCGPCSPTMREAIEAKGARYFPPQPQSSLVQFYQSADLLALPSRSEGQGMVVYEALSCGCDVLLGNYPGSELYENCRGVYYTNLSAADVRNNIRNLLDSERPDSSGKVHVRTLFPTAEQWTNTLLALLQGTHPRTPRLLMVAFQNSVHTARWLQCVAELGWDVHLFATSPWPAHPLIQNVTVHTPIRWPRWLWRWPTLRMKPGFSPPLISLVQEAINRVWRYPGAEAHMDFPAMQGPKRLNKLIHKLQPDLIHSLEFQHCGYLTLEAKRLHGSDFPAWAASSWGSDIAWFGRDATHLPLIRDLLQRADYYIADCERDMKLARELGWNEKPSLVALGFGGITLAPWRELRAKIQTSARTQIMVKAYEHFAGRALTALQAVEQCADVLRDMEIVLFLAEHPDVLAYAQKLRTLGLHLRILPQLPHAEMMKEFGKSRIVLSVSASDGVPATLLEAMVMGAFPIQTNTAAADEWITDAESGFIVPVDDVNIIAFRLRAALADDALVDRASAINWNTAEERIDTPITSEKILSFYRNIMPRKQEP